jgi:hypothetical protein
LVASFSTTLLIAAVLAPQIQLADAGSKSPYDSGYDHGCDDAGISDPSNRYINEPGKGPSSHTNEFMQGYNAGYNACSGDSSRSSGGTQTGMQEEDDWTLTVRLRGANFGTQGVSVQVYGPFEDEYRQTINWQNEIDSKYPEMASTVDVLFDIPKGEIPIGYHYDVCTHKANILDATTNYTCKSFRHMYESGEVVTMSVPN